MTCRDFPLIYSAQLDGHAAEHEQIALQRHLSECVPCRRRAAEMRSLRSDLRSLAAPQLSPELTGQIQNRLRFEAAKALEAEARTVWLSGLSAQLAGAGAQANWVEIRHGWFNSFANWFDGIRAKIFSQTIGAVVSLILFFVVVTNVFKQAYQQAYHTLVLAATATQVIFEDPNQAVIEDPNDQAIRHQALLKAALLPTPPPPALNPSDEFRGVVANLREEDVILTAEVRKDGGATVMYIVPPNDPSVEAKLSTAMSQRGIFQGAGHKHTTSTVAVVYFSSITTTARL